MEYSGKLGLVVIPDDQTRREAVRLARLHCSGATYSVLDQWAHMALHHAPLKNVPKDVVQELLRSLNHIVDTGFTLFSLQEFGRKFLFWDSTRNYRQLYNAHKAAVSALSPFRDTDAIAHARKEGLSLTPAQSQNLERFGHPLVHDEWRPHITLGWQEHGFPTFREETQDMLCRATVQSIAFVQVGPYGRAEEHLLSTNDL